MAKAEITRASGIWVGGYNPGEGYEGLTKELDASVASDAEWLRRHFPGHGVEIRFNSDRRSGGAYLKGLGDPGGVRYAEGWRGFMLEASVGINSAMAVEMDAEALTHAINVDKVFLKPGTRTGGERHYAYESFSTSAAARRWISEHVDRTKVEAASREAARAHRRE